MRSQDSSGDGKNGALKDVTADLVTGYSKPGGTLWVMLKLSFYYTVLKIWIIVLLIIIRHFSGGCGHYVLLLNWKKTLCSVFWTCQKL